MDDDRTVRERARTLSKTGTLAEALRADRLPQFADVSLAEALVLGLLNQGIRKYVGVLGHGNTHLANVIRLYEEAGVVRLFHVRHETEASHCATMLRWHYQESAAVLTSIGPGAMHAFAGSLAAASNRIGVYHLYGDETTHDEGPNMQQLPHARQAGYLRMVEAMGRGYVLHTPEAIFTALRRGAATVFDPAGGLPFFLLLPMNVQPEIIRGCNLAELPDRALFPPVHCCSAELFAEATRMVREAKAITIKFGGGARGCGKEILELARLIDAVAVAGAKMGGVVPYSERRFMTVGGSKGTLCGNYAMENADLAVVIGARAVCQWDCSGTAWKKARYIINFNMNVDDASHYNRSLAILGDAKSNLQAWISILKAQGFADRPGTSPWLQENLVQKALWQRLKKEHFDHPCLHDAAWSRKVLTQPAAIHIAGEFAREHGAACYFDAGDVQANGFQILEDEVEGMSFTDTGSSYMGFAASALLCAALADNPVYTFAFSGDGSFTMNPQVLFDGVQHGLVGCIIIFDNRRMAAISGLQMDQYGHEYKTSDAVETDYVALAGAVKNVHALSGGFTPEEFRSSLQKAYDYHGLSVIHLPVYYGSDPLGGLGEYGTWNVGNWCEAVQAEHHRIGL